MKRTLPFVLASALLLGPLPTWAGDDLTPIPDRPAAPALDLPDVKGARVRLDDYRGKTVIVNFWATWCPPCRAEMPSMQRAYEAMRGEGVELIAVNVGEEAGIIERFRSEVPVTFPMPMDLDAEVAMKWRVKGLPTTYVVGRDGRLVYHAAGEREWDDPRLLARLRGAQ